MKKEIHDFLHQHLSQYLFPKELFEYTKEDERIICGSCGRVHNVIKQEHRNICSSCLLFCHQFQMATKDNAINIRQKDTLILANPEQTIVFGDIKLDSVTDKLKIVKSIPGTGITWRTIFAEYVKNIHQKSAPTLAIIQSKADKSDTFKISHSPDFIYLCGQEQARLNVNNLLLAQEIVEGTPPLDWKTIVRLSVKRNRSENEQKKLDKLIAKHPKIAENTSLLPIANSKEMTVLGWL